VHLLRHVIQFDQIGVTDRPAIDGSFQITEMAEVEVQPDQAGDVIRVVAALENTFARSSQIRRLMIQRQTQLMPALWHSNRVAVFEENCLVAAVGVQIEVIDRVFLPFGPKAFTSDITANGREHVKTHAAQ